MSFGIFFGQFLSYFLKKISGDLTGQDFWVLIFVFPIFTQLIQLAALIFYCPYETPKYLMDNG
jgi:hypothetical protein